MDTIIKDVEKHLKEKEINSNIPTPVITTYYVSAVINVCLLYVKEPKKYKKELIPNTLY